MPAYDASLFDPAAPFARITLRTPNNDATLFLITDQEVGILGRDVLNHISLLLDGPQLFWSEERSVQS